MRQDSIPGDLIVAIEELEHEFLKREGENLHYDLYISFAEAVLGISKDIEAINGKVRIKLEEGIQSGKILRLKGNQVSMATETIYSCKCLTPKH
jgi:molecular chaperone DnaJ